MARPRMYASNADRQRAHRERKRNSEQALLLQLPVTKLNGSDECYTPAYVIETARTMLRSIDLDPASNPYAQSRVQAKQFYTQEDDGLARPWSGRVWVNPPFSRGLIERFTEKAINEYESGNVSAMLMLVNVSTGRWYWRLAARYPVCMFFDRINFIYPPHKRQPHGNARGQAVFYFGRNYSRFKAIYSAWGQVYRP